MVVVGSSVAGVRTAQALRTEGFAGAISIVGDETEWPYDKPPLSKQVLTTGRLESRMRLLERQEAAQLNIDVKLGSAATEVDVAARVVRLADGSALPYGALILATGASARPSPWGSADGVFTLRRLSDALGLSDAFATSRDIAIIGAGLIGMEVASSAASRGLSVTVVDAAAGPMMRVVSPDVATRLVGWYEALGVRFAFGRGIESIGQARGRTTIGFDSGQTVTADCVVVAIGSQPNTDWLAGSDIPVGDGIPTDEFGAVLGLSDVYAVGDVASWWDPASGRHTRHEHWTRTIEQATCLAHTICHPDDRRTVTTPHYSWSDQFGAKLQMIGRIGPDRACFVSGANPDQWAALSGANGALVGATFVNWPRALAAARRGLAAEKTVEGLYAELA